MSNNRPFAMTIAGFDPCGGAGVLADVKTFEANRINGLGVCTSLTYQNENEFVDVSWVPVDGIIKQIDILLKKYKVEYVKIGLIENFDVLNSVINHLISINKEIKIIWDPIFKSSTEFDFHKNINAKVIEDICKKIYLITPNWIEIMNIYNSSESPMDLAKNLSNYCNVFLKGGHNEEKKAYDYLFIPDKYFAYKPKVISDVGKHGSGCVLSSAIIAYLAKGYNLHKACLHAKYYISEFINSNKTLLGYHKL